MRHRLVWLPCVVLLSEFLCLPSPARASSVSAGGSHSAVVKTTDNTVWTWGLNTSGRLGDGTQTQRTQPVQVNSLSSAAMVAAGGAHTLVLKSNGTVWAFGSNSFGQLGYNSTATQSLTPVQVVGITGTVVGIAAGDNHSLAWTSDGKLYSWGRNSNGQLGLGDQTDRRSAVQVTFTGNPTPSVTHASAGTLHSLAVTSDTTAWGFGFNSSGRLGDGTQTQRTSPVHVLDGAGATITGFSKVAAGGSHSLAVKTDGSAWAWGNGAYGRLGDGTTVSRNIHRSVGS
jgi:alpha-tubulin suppressor-like RCC1 family protein